MRLILASGVAALTLAGGLAAAPSSADSVASVGAVTVTATNMNDGTPTVNVSWASEPSNADGALVCLHRGTTIAQTPSGSNCESEIAVDAPTLSSGPITFFPGKNYVIEVFSYKTTSPIVYGAPVSRVRQGVKVGMVTHCGSQTVGSACRLTATVTNASSGARLASRQVQLWMSKEQQPAHWTLITTKTTNSSGVATATVTLSKSRLYEWYYSSPRPRELSSSSSRVDIAVVSR